MRSSVARPLCAETSTASSSKRRARRSGGSGNDGAQSERCRPWSRGRRNAVSSDGAGAAASVAATAADSGAATSDGLGGGDLGGPGRRLDQQVRTLHGTRDGGHHQVGQVGRAGGRGVPEPLLDLATEGVHERGACPGLRLHGGSMKHRERHSAAHRRCVAGSAGMSGASRAGCGSRDDREGPDVSESVDEGLEERATGRPVPHPAGDVDVSVGTDPTRRRNPGPRPALGAVARCSTGRRRSPRPASASSFPASGTRTPWPRAGSPARRGRAGRPGTLRRPGRRRARRASRPRRGPRGCARRGPAGRRRLRPRRRGRRTSRPGRAPTTRWGRCGRRPRAGRPARPTASARRPSSRSRARSPTVAVCSHPERRGSARPRWSGLQRVPRVLAEAGGVGGGEAAEVGEPPAHSDGGDGQLAGRRRDGAPRGCGRGGSRAASSSARCRPVAGRPAAARGR